MEIRRAEWEERIRGGGGSEEERMRRRKGKEGMRRGLEEETCRGERGNGEVEERRPRRGVAERSS